MVTQYETSSEIPNAQLAPDAESFDGEQGLMRLWGHSGARRIFVSLRKKASDFEPKLREFLINGVRTAPLTVSLFFLL